MHLIGQRILVAKKRVQVMLSDDFTERHLGSAIQRLTEVVTGTDAASRIRDTKRQHRVQSQRHLVAGHQFLSRDIQRLLARIDLDHTSHRQSLPERIASCGQCVDVTSIDEQHTLLVPVDVADVQRGIDSLAASDHGEFIVLETSVSRIDDFDSHLSVSRPQCVTAGRQNLVEAAVNPNQSSLVIAQVQSDGAFLQQSRVSDLVDLFVREDHVSRGNDLDTRTHGRIENPVTTRFQNSRERSITKNETKLMGTDTNSSDHRKNSSRESGVVRKGG